VEDRTWPSTLDPADASWVITGNLDINISYLEIPLQIGYSIKIRNHFFSSFFTGYSLSIPMKDNTKHIEKEVRELDPDERGKYNFNYVLVDESGVSWSKNYYVGLRLSFNRFALLIRYAKALSFTKDIEGISIRDKIDNFEISIAYLF